MKTGSFRLVTSAIVLSTLFATQANASLVTSSKHEQNSDERLSYYLSGMENNNILAAENSVLNIPIDLNHQFNSNYVVYSDNDTISGQVKNNVLTLNIEEVSKDTTVSVSLVSDDESRKTAFSLVVNVLDQPTFAMPNYAIALNEDAELSSALSGASILNIDNGGIYSNGSIDEFSPFSQKSSSSYATASRSNGKDNASGYIAYAGSKMPALTPDMFSIEMYLPSSNGDMSNNQLNDPKEAIIAAFKKVAAQHQRNNAPTITVAGSPPPQGAEEGNDNTNGSDEQNNEQVAQQENTSPNTHNAGDPEGTEPNSPTGDDNEEFTANNDGDSENEGENSPFVTPTPANENAELIVAQTTVTEIPEPATSAIFALALAGLVTRQKLKKQSI
ncbi:PEP-CTERM sorting domain-containing protein [Thalassotalea fusca]